MYEVEVRARLSSRDMYETLEAKLNAMQCESLGKKRLKDTVYGLKGLYSIKKTGFCYRIREHGNKVIVDRKDQLPDSWKEEILPFYDKKDANKYFLNRGFFPYLIIDRIRHEYKKDNITIALDNVMHLGQFIEIEKSVETPDLVEAAKKDLINFLKLLGISEGSIEPAPYGWLLTLELEKNIKLAEKMADELGITISQLFGK